MRSVIEDLYYGNLCPLTQMKQYHKNNDEFLQEMDTFFQKLDTEKSRKLDEFMSKQLEIMSQQVEQAFTYGFKLGVQLTSEVFCQNGGAEQASKHETE